MRNASQLFFASLLLSSTLFANPSFPLANTGDPFPLDYTKYGEFSGIGGNDYKFKITDRKGLADAMGEGLYPANGLSMQSDPLYQKWLRTKPPVINAWDYVQTSDSQTEFYVWAHTANVGPGTKLFYEAQALAEAGHFTQALKAYYQIVVVFPREACWAANNSFVWYVGREALSRIESITKRHPEIGYRLKGAVIRVTNDSDTNLSNDAFVIDPGHWEKRGSENATDVTHLKELTRRGRGKVQLVEYENKSWRLLVDGKPYVVKGITYSPTKVGKDLSDKNGNAWMFADEDGNGKIDTAFDTWVDKNGDGHQDKNEKAVGDFALLKEMGANTIRLYRYVNSPQYSPQEFNKPLLRRLHDEYGISCIMGDFLGAYTVGSLARWDDGTDYTNQEQRERMKAIVHDYVLDHKDEPYVLMWLLGNENLMKPDYSGVNATRTQAANQVEAYLKFVNEVAQMIHELDPDHPVAVGNLDLNDVEEHGKFADAVDVYGANSYRGENGFGNLFGQIQMAFDRPVLITEYGCDAYNSVSKKEDEEMQAKYHRGAWDDIRLNLAGGPEVGNAIGGVAFEFLDEWWKSQEGSWQTHETANDSPMNFPDGWSSEEWFGLVSQGDGQHSPFLRKLRKAYFVYKNELWKNDRALTAGFKANVAP